MFEQKWNVKLAGLILVALGFALGVHHWFLAGALVAILSYPDNHASMIP